MCRAGGRRCPGQYDPAKAAARNAKRRAQRAAAKRNVAGGDGENAGAAAGGANGVVDSGNNSTAAMSAHEAAMAAMREEIASLPDHGGEERKPGKRAEEMEEYSPLTDLDIDNPYFTPEGMEMIYAMEDVAANLEASGNHEAANLLRFGGREIATMASPMRLEVLGHYYRRRGMQSHHDGNEHLRDAYYTLDAVTQEAARQDIIRKKDDVMRRHYTSAMRALTDKFYTGEIRDFSSTAQWEQEEYDRRRNILATSLDEVNTERFSVGDHSYTAKEILEGRGENGEEIPRETYGELIAQVNHSMAENADTITKAICKDGHAPERVDPDELSEDAYYDPDDDPYEYPEGEAHRGREVEGAPGFVQLGKGAEHDVYLHRPTGLVYKIPWANSMIIQNHSGRISQEDVERATQEAYASVHDTSLRDHGVENVRTSFVTSAASGQRHHLMVQPLYAPSDWEGVELSPAATSALKNMGVSDLHSGNVKVNLRTREIRLIDCLDTPRLGME